MLLKLISLGAITPCNSSKQNWQLNRRDDDRAQLFIEKHRFKFVKIFKNK